MQIERDKRLVESLISSKKIDAFVRRYREVIFDIIDKQMKKIDSSATLTLARKGQLMSNFIDNLLTNDAKLLQNYLHPKRLRANNDTEDFPSLDGWIHLQCVRFFNAKLIIDGILSKNSNAIKTFFFSEERPGCREMFSKWIRIYHVFEGDNTSLQDFIDGVIKDFVNVLCVDIDKDAKEQLEITAGKRPRRRIQKDSEYSALTSLKNYRFEGDFYTYFRNSVIHPYLIKSFFKPKLIIDGILSKNINVIKTFFFSKERPGCREMFSKWICTNHVFEGDNASLQNFIDGEIREYVNVLFVDIDKYAKEQLEISAGERQRRRKQKDYEYSALTSLKSFRFEGDFYAYFRDSVVHPYLAKKFFHPNSKLVSIDIVRDNGENSKQLEIASPNDSFHEYEYRDFLERIFCVMERTQKGREQVEVLKLVFHLVTFESHEIKKDKDIAEILNISPRMLTYKKEQALKTAREIAKTLDLSFIGFKNN